MNACRVSLLRFRMNTTTHLHLITIASRTLVRQAYDELANGAHSIVLRSGSDNNTIIGHRDKPHTHGYGPRSYGSHRIRRTPPRNCDWSYQLIAVARSACPPWTPSNGSCACNTFLSPTRRRLRRPPPRPPAR